MTHAAQYSEQYTVCAVDPETGPCRGSGSGSGATFEFRSGRHWTSDGSIERSARQRTKMLRDDAQRAIEREQQRVDAIGPVRRRLRKTVPRTFLITARLSRRGPDHELGIALYEAPFTAADPESLDLALSGYQRFVLASEQAARDEEMILAQERAAGFWSEWVGA